MVELVGPSMFSHWEQDGQKVPDWTSNAKPVGKANPVAYVQVAAVSMDQTGNTMDMLQGMLPERTRQHYRMDVQKEITYANGGRNKLKAIGSSHRSAEGGRVTFAILNEIHHWVPSRGGQDLYKTIANNTVKVQGRFICITNAYEPGEESVHQEIREDQEKVWAGLAKPSGWLYDSLEAHPDAPLDERWLPYIINTVRGDAYWLNIEDIVESIQDGSIAPSTHRRMWLNQVVASEDSLVSAAEWQGALAAGMTGTKHDLSPGDEITLGFDGSKTDDATALVAIRIKDKLIVPLAIWQKPQVNKDWHINESEVDSEVHQAFASFTVRAFYADVALWESYINNWSEAYREKLLIKASTRSAVGFDMRANEQRQARGNEALVQTIVDGRIKHNGDKILKVHVLNAKRRRNRFGLWFGKDKEESPRKVDGYAATLLAFMAMTDLAESGKTAKPEYTRRLIQF